MSAGIQANAGLLNQQAGQLAINLRNDFQAILNFANWLNTVGSAGLVSMGIVKPDADVIVSTIGNLAQLAQIYMGQQTLAQPFNYMANSYAVTGGQ